MYRDKLIKEHQKEIEDVMLKNSMEEFSMIVEVIEDVLRSHKVPANYEFWRKAKAEDYITTNVVIKDDIKFIIRVDILSYVEDMLSNEQRLNTVEVDKYCEEICDILIDELPGR